MHQKAQNIHANPISTHFEFYILNFLLQTEKSHPSIGNGSFRTHKQ